MKISVRSSSVVAVSPSGATSVDSAARADVVVDSAWPAALTTPVSAAAIGATAEPIAPPTAPNTDDIAAIGSPAAGEGAACPAVAASAAGAGAHCITGGSDGAGAGDAPPTDGPGSGAGPDGRPGVGSETGRRSSSSEDDVGLSGCGGGAAFRVNAEYSSASRRSSAAFSPVSDARLASSVVLTRRAVLTAVISTAALSAFPTPGMRASDHVA
ncbi:hypothetical protein MCHUDSM44219_05276 [Mycolicibacterium chubuense]|uniref:Uncharacterized protein n=1 Tax=Mycolicibacterium chubuense TaxID=1800 RepID=A0A0J6YEI4_MYCCU|nr:hypothetical protein MCHUDSM44219_05276 [Mycolicibacterium chubuense]